MRKTRFYGTFDQTSALIDAFLASVSFSFVFFFLLSLSLSLSVHFLSGKRDDVRSLAKQLLNEKSVAGRREISSPLAKKEKKKKEKKYLLANRQRAACKRRWTYRTTIARTLAVGSRERVHLVTRTCIAAFRTEQRFSYWTFACRSYWTYIANRIGH